MEKNGNAREHVLPLLLQPWDARGQGLSVYPSGSPVWGDRGGMLLPQSRDKADLGFRVLVTEGA